ncbi:MAG: chromosomal replication initiator protein DnaA [Candidatus Magasanikbacteria bacterium]|nr:chromosomal replication initiator protein DnaA [Candidatus Magasanikbacteria bacterium]
MQNYEIWQAVLGELELSISKANFITWFKNTGIISYQEGMVVLCVPNAFTKAWMEKKYHHTIITSLERVTGKPLKRVEYKIESLKNLAIELVITNKPLEVALPSFADLTPAVPVQLFNNNGGFTVNTKYRFENFVVGKGNELAYAAAQAVVNRPGTAYNPLFIYGGVGLGKTHLIQAVGNELRKNNPDISILYVSAEKFSNDFISSIREKTVKDFQNRYRTIDLLLIDDIQFIAGKEGTQESFFHTFNELHQQNKQVILTSDRPPKAIPALEDRLKSRFEWGMIADIAAPDFETRVAILDRKCQEKFFLLPVKILESIATSVQSNIRELEGALNKIIVYHQLKNLPPSLESVKMLLTSWAGTPVRQSLTPRQLLETVSQFYSLNVEDIISKNREKKISLPRQVIMFLMREELKMSYPAIGGELGGRDHTTAMHAHEKIRRELNNDLKLKQEVDLIKQRVYVNNL